ncbi:MULTISPECIES: hypothetical protein [unclassified Halobacteriovorax]|uniref:hypothetical protein n=1 Tax=unclassified Halobacteriovorax TaxID=2639665 RepID=UPI000EA00C09|nr:hypothetical protein [Halobacteriovorax sp. BALOs_7]
MKYFLMILLLCSCAVSKTKLTEEGSKVKVTYQKPRKNCTVFTSVIGENENGIKDLAINHAINQVADKGGNTIFIKEAVNEGGRWKVTGMGYHCK